MLWYKAWLETRWRFIFALGMIVLLCGLCRFNGFRVGGPASRQWFGLQLESVLLSVFTAIFLAGAGINAQTTLRRNIGVSWLDVVYTVAPVSRRRLLFVRAGFGAILTCVLVAIMAGYTLFFIADSHECTSSADVRNPSNRLHHVRICSVCAAGLPA